MIRKGTPEFVTPCAYTYQHGFDLDDLRAFLAVAECQGFRRAAEAIQIEQSAVSRRIRKLEECLGASLFERQRGATRLTVIGRRFREDVTSVFAQLQEAVRSAQAGGRADNGFLRIGVIASISSGFFSLVLQEYRMKHSQVQIDIIEGDHCAHMGNIVACKIDIGLVTGVPDTLPGTETEPLWKEQIFVAVATNHELARAHRLTWSQLVDQKFIVSRAAPGPGIQDFLVSRLAKIGHSPRINLHDVNREGLLALVGLGFGLTLVSGAEVGVVYANVRLIPLAEEMLPFTAIWSPDNDNPALRRLLSVARVQARKANAALLSQTRDPSP